MNDEFKTQRGLSMEMPRITFTLRHVDLVCKKCGLNMKNMSFELWKSKRKYRKCEHDWEDILVKTEVIGGD